MKIGYNEATAKDCSTLQLDLRLCEEAGFDFIEIRMDMLAEYLVDHTLDDLAAFFAASRLKPHALNAFYLYPEFLGEKDDPAKRHALLTELALGFEAAGKIGAGHAIVVAPLQRDPAGGPYPGTWEETFPQCVRILTRLSSMAALHGVRLCFELVGFERSGVRTVEQADAIIRAVDRDNVGLVLDSYNIYLHGQTNDFSVIRQVDPAKIFAVHINNADDVPASEMGQDKRRFCDAGCLDLDNFLSTLRDVGYEGMVSIETFRPEYWSMRPEWVVEEAYRTTREALLKQDAL